MLLALLNSFRPNLYAYDPITVSRPPPGTKVCVCVCVCVSGPLHIRPNNRVTTATQLELSLTDYQRWYMNVTDYHDTYHHHLMSGDEHLDNTLR